MTRWPILAFSLTGTLLLRSEELLQINSLQQQLLFSPAATCSVCTCNQAANSSCGERLAQCCDFDGVIVRCVSIQQLRQYHVSHFPNWGQITHVSFHQHENTCQDDRPVHRRWLTHLFCFYCFHPSDPKCHKSNLQGFSILIRLHKFLAARKRRKVMTQVMVCLQLMTVQRLLATCSA